MPKSGSPKKSSPKKSSPDKKGSKSDSPKKGDKKSGKSLPKWSADECMKAEESTFARIRYETPLQPSYKRASLHIVLICKKIHLYEVYNDSPPVQQHCNSNKGSKGSKDKSPKSKDKSPKSKDKSPKSKDKSPKGKKVEEDKPPPPEHERPILEGVVAIRRNILLNEAEKLWVEVTGTWKYAENSKVTPFRPSIHVQHQCYRDYNFLFPKNYERPTPQTDYNQELVLKIRKEYGYEWEGYPFYFDLTGCPDSVNFNRPYVLDEPVDGLFWELRCFIGRYEFTKPDPSRECRMNFYKYTIAPSLLTLALRKSSPWQYIRYKTLDDSGDLLLTASLDKDLYYHGEEINVTINIENNSQRHLIESITVFYEQNYRFFHEIPHDDSIPLGEVWLRPGENGMPINPKSKSFSKTVQIKPLFDWSKYNLVTDGRMFRDEKIFLACSTLIIKNVPLSPEELKELETTDDRKSKSPDKKSKSPDKKDKKSPDKKSKSPDKKSKSPDKKSKSPNKKDKKSPKKGDEPDEVPEEDVYIDEYEQAKPPSKKVLLNTDICHTVYISYDIVVRCNLKTPSDDEAGHPQVRVPFILTRETRFINEWTNPPTWNHFPLKCDTVHTCFSQPHSFCRKYQPKSEQMEEMRDKSSPKSKSKEKSPKDKSSSKKGSPKGSKKGSPKGSKK